MYPCLLVTEYLTGVHIGHRYWRELQHQFLHCQRISDETFTEIFARLGLQYISDNCRAFLVREENKPERSPVRVEEYRADHLGEEGDELVVSPTDIHHDHPDI